jgi:hypothetical protein
VETLGLVSSVETLGLVLGQSLVEDLLVPIRHLHVILGGKVLGIIWVMYLRSRNR